MTEDLKRIFEYMEWFLHEYAKSGKLWGTGICVKCKHPLPKSHLLDGNDMVAAMNKMVEKGDWESFEIPCFKKSRCAGTLKYIPWLMQPARFLNSWQTG